MTVALAGEPPLQRLVRLDLVHVTERAAIAAAHLSGRGDERAADVAAARTELDRLPLCGRIAIGEGDEGAVPHLFVGEEVGSGEAVGMDIALDAVEGATLCAKNLPDALSVMAVTAPGGFMRVPCVYMDKIAVGGGLPDGVVDLDASPGQNLAALAAAKGVAVSGLTACILDRPRNAALIEAVRRTGAAIRLISDGDVAAVVHTAGWDENAVDIYLGVGGAAEGILAAAALRCAGGQMQGRLLINDADARERAGELGIEDPHRKYAIADMVRSEVAFVATGITDGSLLSGVRFTGAAIETDRLLLSSTSRARRRVVSRHEEAAR